MNSNFKEFCLVCGFMVAAMAVFYIIGFGVLSVIAAAAALCFIMLRCNMAYVVTGVVLVFITDGVLNWSFSFFNGLVICLSAMCINLAVRNHCGLLKVCIAGVLGVFTAYAVSFSIAGIFDLEGFRIADVKYMFEQISETFKNVMIQSGAAELYTENELALAVNFALMSVVPSTVLLTAAAVSFFITEAVKKMMEMVKSDMCRAICGFSQIWADKTCFIILAVSFVIYLLFSSGNQIIGAAAFAMSFVLSVYLYICGLSVGAFFIKKNISLTAVKKILLYIGLIMAAVVLAPTVFLIGAVDSFADVRKLRRGI